MARRTVFSVLFFMCGCACLCTAQAPAQSGPGEGQKLDLAAECLKVARRFHPDVDVNEYLRKLDALGLRLAGRIKDKTSVEEKLVAMRQFLYGEERYANPDLIPAEVFVGLDEVIDQRQWNCLGLSLLYVVLGRRLDLALHLVTGPGHALVRCSNGGSDVYIETTDQGKLHDSLLYLNTYLPYPCAKADRFKSLDDREALATVMTQSAAAVLQAGQAPQALSVLNDALALWPSSAETFVGLGTAFMNVGDVEHAQQAFQKAADLDPKLVEAHGGLGNVLFQKGMVKEAVSSYRNLLAVCGEDPKGNFNYAHILYESGDLDGAIAAYRKYSTLQPNDPAGYTGVAFPLEDKGDLDGAIAAYTKALELDPQQPDAWVNLGLVHAKKREFDKAIAAHEHALKLQPRYGLARQGRGEALMGLGRSAEALQDFTAAAMEMPNDSSVVVDLAAALVATGKAKEALGLLIPLQARDPNNADVYEGLAEAYEKVGDTASAQKARQTVTKLRDKNQ